jgi:hypothetical protein
LHRGTIITIWVFFFQDQYLSGLDYGLVSVRRAYYQLLRRFSIRAYSPSDKRGKSCSRNRGLRIRIRADNERFLLSLLPLQPLTRCKTVDTYPPFSERKFSIGV